MLNLQRDLEHLKVEQSKEQGMLGKILSQLTTLISIHKPIAGPSSARMIDSEVQTSPGLLDRFCVISTEKHQESMMMCNRPAIYSGKEVEQNQCPLTTQKTQSRNAHALPVQKQQTAVTQEVSHDASQRLWCTQLVETTSSSLLVDTQSTASIEEHEKHYVDRHLVPEKTLNRLSTDALPPLKVPRRRQKALNYRGKRRALVLPQRQPVRKGAVKFSKDSPQNEDFQCEQKDRVPLSSLCDNWKITNKSVAENHLKLQQQATVAPVSRCVAEQPLNPFSLWSEDTESSQMVEYKMAEWENVVPEPKANVVVGEGGLWQLFDFTNDSE